MALKECQKRFETSVNTSIIQFSFMDYITHINQQLTGSTYAHVCLSHYAHPINESQLKPLRIEIEKRNIFLLGQSD